MLQVPVEVIDAEAGLIAFDDEDGSRIQQSAFGGLAKLQWKVDWAARWVALGVDYEMSGKDLIDSVTQSGKIARILGGRPPEGFNYEMFLDEKGEKISKSKGNGLSLEEWLRYGSEPSLAFYIYREPEARQEPAHRRHPARGRRILAVPRANIPSSRSSRSSAIRCTTSTAARCRRRHAAGDLRPAAQSVSLPGVADKETAWKFVQRYAPGTSPDSRSRARRADRPRGQLCPRFRRPGRSGAARRATWKPKRCATSIRELAKLPADASAEDIQTQVFEVGKRHPFESLRGWFQALYETLLGSSQGPRMGSFIALYGIDNSRKPDRRGARPAMTKSPAPRLRKSCGRLRGPRSPVRRPCAQMGLATRRPPAAEERAKFNAPDARRSAQSSCTICQNLAASRGNARSASIFSC